MGHVDVGHFAGHRHQVIGHVGIGELAALVIDAFLEQRRPEALHHAAADLLVDQLRIDDGAAILHHPVPQQPDKAGIGVDFEPGRLHAVGEGERIFARHEMPGRHQLGLDAGRQRVRPEIDDSRQLAQFDAGGAIPGVHDRIADDIELGGRRLQDRGGDIQDVAAQHLGGLQGGFAADPGAARGPGAAAIGRVVGIAENDADPLHRDAEHAADDLRGQRFRALPLLADAGLADHRSRGIQPHRDAVLRRDAGAADAIEGRARIGDLDEAGDADAAVNVFAAQRRLFGPQGVVVHHLHQLVEGGMMRQQLEAQARRRCAGVAVIRNQVAAADLHRIHADLRSRKVDQAFRHRAGDRMADAAVLAHDILVLEHDAGPGAIVLGDVGSAHQIDDLVGLDGAGARIHRIGTDAGEVVDLERGDGAIAHHRDPSLATMVAGMDIGVEAFDPVGDELDRPAQQFRQRIDRHFIGVDVHLDAERAADILADHPHLGLPEPQMQCGDVLHHVRRLGALVDRQSRFGGVPVGHHRARLQRHAGVPPKHEFRLRHLVGKRKRGINGAGVEPPFESEVVTERGMNHRRFRIQRCAHVGHRLQFAVLDRDDFGSVLGGGATGRHDGRDRLALPADKVGRDRALGSRLQTLEVRQHAHPRRDHGRELFAGDDGDDAGRAPRRLRIDVQDLRMGIGRAQEHHMRHARQVDVADIEPAPLHQPLEIGPRHQLADIGVRPVQHRRTFRICRLRHHGLRPMRARAVVSTASTMAW